MLSHETGNDPSPHAYNYVNTRERADPDSYDLIIRQQPVHARLCSFKEKVDRRPIDPPEYLQNPYFFMYACLANADTRQELNFVNGNRTTAGTVVQSPYRLKDVDNTDGGFFIFPDMSVRMEGVFRLKFSLFDIVDGDVTLIKSIFSEPFTVYSPKQFPGMSESTFLTRSFSDQGVRIRIRKENRVGSSKRKLLDDGDDDGSDGYRIKSPRRGESPQSISEGPSPSPTYRSEETETPPSQMPGYAAERRRRSAPESDAYPTRIPSPRARPNVYNDAPSTYYPPYPAYRYSKQDLALPRSLPTQPMQLPPLQPSLPPATTRPRDVSFLPSADKEFSTLFNQYCNSFTVTSKPVPNPPVLQPTERYTKCPPDLLRPLPKNT
ncbi:hypothetical protein BZG36_00377 [Bifiguratus adelaidae]|uniref:Velvet domain-containing protein n=1 Tax=Bifiguratus adelaidae TaxID=1938954 RepID=A0A261Y7N1_9FUNG|nr:hypothetical protein BZG36_00377 [Bifiguratus adelaidae]